MVYEEEARPGQLLKLLSLGGELMKSDEKGQAGSGPWDGTCARPMRATPYRRWPLATTAGCPPLPAN